MSTNVIYFITIFLGFIIPFIISIINNKKYNYIKTEFFLYCYFIFLLFFMVFAKGIFVITNNQTKEFIQSIFTQNILTNFAYIASGYSFIGGYIGGLIGITIFLHIIRCNKQELIYLFSLNLLLMYSILKIGCFIQGCCYSTSFSFPIQLIESIFTFCIIMLTNHLKRKHQSILYLIGINIFLFSLLRFATAFFRYYSTYLGYLFNQIICIILLIVSLYLTRTKRTCM